MNLVIRISAELLIYIYKMFGKFFTQPRLILCLALTIFIFPVNSCFADIVYLKNGRNMEGIVQSEDSAHVKLQIGIGTVTLNKSQVDHIYRSTVPESAAITAGWEENKRRDEALEKESQALEKSRAVQMELQPKETKISGKDGSLFVKVLLNKKVPATLVLDTGAQTVLLTKAIAKKLGLSLKTAPHVMGQLADGRKVPATRVNLDSVQVDQSEIKNVEADVFLEEKSELTQDGLLGMSFLKHFTFRVDYKHNRLVLEKLK